MRIVQFQPNSKSMPDFSVFSNGQNARAACLPWSEGGIEPQHYGRAPVAITLVQWCLPQKSGAHIWRNIVVEGDIGKVRTPGGITGQGTWFEDAGLAPWSARFKAGTAVAERNVVIGVIDRYVLEEEGKLIQKVDGRQFCCQVPIVSRADFHISGEGEENALAVVVWHAVVAEVASKEVGEANFNAGFDRFDKIKVDTKIGAQCMVSVVGKHG